MYLTEKEIFDKYRELKKTYEYFMDRAKEIKELKHKNRFESITFIGSGSSYCLCQSAEISAKAHTPFFANSIPAGDLMLNFPYYGSYLKNTLLVTSIRLGNSSEVVIAIRKAKNEYGIPCISIYSRDDTEAATLVDFSDEGVVPLVFTSANLNQRDEINTKLLEKYRKKIFYL